MTLPAHHEAYERTIAMLRPALERVATDAEFRHRLEHEPLAALAEMRIELDAHTRQELEGRRFSEFWANRQRAAEGPVGVRDLPPGDGSMPDQALESVAGGLLTPLRTPLSPIKPTTFDQFAPPYVPVGPVTGSW